MREFSTADEGCYVTGAGISSSKKVIVVGIDGLTWSILAPRISSGGLPTFQKVVSLG